VNIMDALSSFGDGFDVTSVNVSRNDEDGTITLTMTARVAARRPERAAAPPRTEPRKTKPKRSAARMSATQRKASERRYAQMWAERNRLVCRALFDAGEPMTVSALVRMLAPQGLSKSAVDGTIKRCRERELIRLAGFQNGTGGAAAQMFALLPDGEQLAQSEPETIGPVAEPVA
jgi:regulator of protease activity HflC (stomatin/prohibitin superfamily)